jgi:uncharacterized membrane protein
MQLKLEASEFILMVAFLQIVECIVVLFNIPVARQVIGFFFFTFIPGILLIILLNLNEKFETSETILFSLGFSIVFLVFMELLINELGYLFRVYEPLSFFPTFIIMNGLIFLGTISVFIKANYVPNSKFFSSLSHFYLALILLLLPILSVIGIICINVFGNNLLILFLILISAIIFINAVVLNRFFSRFYTLIIFAVALSLLYQGSLVSKYIVSFGSDAPYEHFVFKITEENRSWASTGFYGSDIGRLNSMLSITILPTFYSIILGMDSTWILKILFPLFFSLVPVGLYRVWKTYVKEKYAFIAAFFFISYETFYTEMLGLNRQMIAELFFVLLLLVLLKNEMNRISKLVYFISFSFGLITSHYGLSLIFLFIISATFILLFVTKKSCKITISMLLLFFSILFAWYVFTSKSAVFESILEFGNHVYNQLNDFFNPKSRGQQILEGLGLETPPTIWNAIGRAFAYFTEFFIVVGFIGLLVKRKKVHFGREYFAFTVIAMIFLIILILIPGLAETMNMTRFYHVLLFFLAPLCVIGVDFLMMLLVKRLEKRWTIVILLGVLVPYFFFQTSFVYEVTGSESWSLPLSMHRMSGYMLYCTMGYIPEQDVFGAYWLKKYANSYYTQLYADTSYRRAPVAYGLVDQNKVILLSNTTSFNDGEVVYLSNINIVYGMVVSYGKVWNFSQLTFLVDISKIYSNGVCEIDKSTS